MEITKIENSDKEKYRISVDEEFAFQLNRKEMDLYQLYEGMQLSPELYSELIEDLVFPHAKQKALSVLKFMDRSEHELKQKLLEAGFTQDIIDRTLQYVYTYGYLDDERFTRAYVRSRMNRKSKLAIKTELLQKGISKELISIAFDQEYSEDETEDAELAAIRKAISKKTKNPEELSKEEKQKLIASLYRKGFDLSKIKQLIP